MYLGKLQKTENLQEMYEVGQVFGIAVVMV